MAPVHPLGALAPLAGHPRPQFIVALLVPMAGGRTDKLPIDHRTAAPHDAHDPAIWTTYENARATAAAWGSQFTVGFVITADDPFVVIDIDGALDAQTNQWSPLSHQLVAALPGAVVEVSQSGRGLHIWARCSIVPAHSKKCVPLHIEAYSSRRFIVLGSRAVGTMALECTAVPEVLARYFPPRETLGAEIPDDGPCAEWSGPTDDDELLRRAMQSRSARSAFNKNRATFADLFHADETVLARAYPPDGSSSDPYDRSSADAALAQHLAFWTGKDTARIERLMRRSKLYREKWDSNARYLVEHTITFAASNQRDVLQDKPKPPREAGVGASAPRYGMTPEDPLNTARALIQRRFAHDDGARLKTWQNTFYQWGAAHWIEMPSEDVRAELYDFLDKEGESYYRPTQSKVSNLIDALRAAAHLSSDRMPPCWISGDVLAPPGELVACANGLLQLRTRSMLPATPRFFNMNAVPFNYEPSAAAPSQWLQFLRAVWPSDSESIDTLQEVFGYLLTPDTSQQKIFLLIGPKRSGKGTIARVLTEMLGVANVAGPSLASLAKEFGLQPLIGKQAAIIADARLGGHVDAKQVAENLLRISGEDRVDVARKNTSSLSLRLAVRFVLLTNELPRIADASGAIASRFVILTMTESFLGREDPGLTSKLLGELPGVLAWAVEGWHRLNTRGHFIEPKSSAGTAQELADLGAPIAAFVRDECACGPHSTVETGALFNVWRVWCAKQGMNHPGTLQTFGRDLRAAFPSITTSQARSDGDRIRLYRGIALRGTQWHAGQSIASYAPGMPQ